MTSNLITLPKKVDAVKPKLRRSEILAVMARRILARETEAYEKGKADHEKREAALHAEILKLSRASCEEVVVISNYSTQNVNINIDVSKCVTADLRRRVTRLADDQQELRRKYGWTGSTYKHLNYKHALELARGLLGDPVASGDRTADLLNDAGMVKVFDAFITKLENADTDKKAIAV